MNVETDIFAKELYLNAEMIQRKKEACSKLKNFICPKLIAEFSKILHYAWQENLPEAETITNELDLYPIDFCALMEDKEEFEILLLKEKEELFYA